MTVCARSLKTLILACPTVVGFHLFVKGQTYMMSTMSNQPISSPVLIGQQREVARLRALIDQVKQGRWQVLLLSGEAGIGKSRLLAEGKRQADEQGFLVLQGTCFPIDRSSPYAPLLNLLSLSTANSEPLASALTRLFPSLVDHVSSEPSSHPIEPEQDKRRLFVALSQFFTGLADTQPVLLAVEDLHWSDETSLEFLHFLSRRCAAHRLFLVLTYRHDEMHPGLSKWLAQLDHEFVSTLFSKAEVEAICGPSFIGPARCRHQPSMPSMA